MDTLGDVDGLALPVQTIDTECRNGEYYDQHGEDPEREGLLKTPERVVIVDALPLLPTGKPDRAALEATFGVLASYVDRLEALLAERQAE